MARYSITMKATALLILINCVIFSHQEDEGIKIARDECIAEIGVDSKLVHEAFHDGNFVEDEKLKCFAKCYLEKRGTMDAGGNIVEKEYEGDLKEKKAQAFQKCKDQKGDDACATAYLFSKCFRTEILKP